MTNDELRRACEGAVEHILDCVTALPDESLSVERGCAIARLLAFAKRMQADGLREAKRYGENFIACSYEIEKVINWCEERATELEHAGTPYPGWCRHPDQCRGKMSCPDDPTCAD